jgi:hypothetical protein
MNPCMPTAPFLVTDLQFLTDGHRRFLYDRRFRYAPGGSGTPGNSSMPPALPVHHWFNRNYRRFRYATGFSGTPGNSCMPPALPVHHCSTATNRQFLYAVGSSGTSPALRYTWESLHFSGSSCTPGGSCTLPAFPVHLEMHNRPQSSSGAPVRLLGGSCTAPRGFQDGAAALPVHNSGHSGTPLYIQVLQVLCRLIAKAFK